jgi:hypothetical protein
MRHRALLSGLLFISTGGALLPDRCNVSRENIATRIRAMCGELEQYTARCPDGYTCLKVTWPAKEESCRDLFDKDFYAKRVFDGEGCGFMKPEPESAEPLQIACQTSRILYYILPPQ